MRFDFVLRRGPEVLASGRGMDNPPVAHYSRDILYPLVISVEQEFELLTGVRLHLNIIEEEVPSE